MDLDRRDLLRLTAVLSAALEGRAEGQQSQSAEPSRVSKDMLAQALQLIGLSFTAEQQAMMLPQVNRQLINFENLRKIDVPLDTEPAFAFRPLINPERLPKAPVFRHSPLHMPRGKRAPEDIAFLTATELAGLIRTRQVTSTELTRLYIDRLKKYGPKLNCVITLTEDLAMEQAARADAEIRAGHRRGPLHGIPWGAKDLFATKGIKTTWGAEPYRDYIPDHDATVVERLEKAGAVLVAKLSMGALAQGGLWYGGMTKTPWNVDATSSGSSAGSASATAAGLVGFSLGTETLGSIISPSTRCGTSGLRPTYGRVSRHGAMALSWTMDKIGPICRSAEDCALVLHAIYGPDAYDRTVIDAPLEWDARLPLASLRIGIIQSDFDNGLPDAKPVLQQALADLKKAGIQAAPVEAPKTTANTIRFLLTAEAAAAFDDLTRSKDIETLRGQAPGDWPNSFRSSRLIPAVEYIRAQRARTLLMRQYDDFMSDWDVLIGLPNSTMVATNLTGHPQAVVPCGFSSGMPVTMLFTAGLCHEGAALRVAHAYQQVTDWHRRRPPIEPRPPW